jgi:hypothetical protein
MARPRGRPFPPGVSGNPGGRPPGVKEETARGLIRRLVLEVVQEGEAAVRATIRRLLKDPRTAVQVLELAAKLNGEIGRSADFPPTSFPRPVPLDLGPLTLRRCHFSGREQHIERSHDMADGQNQSANEGSGGAQADQVTSRLVIDSDEGVAPTIRREWSLGRVDEVNGRGAMAVPGFVASRAELLVLVKYWFEIWLDVLFSHVFDQMLSRSTQRRVFRFAARRLNRIADALGDEDGFWTAIDGVLQEYAGRKDPLAREDLADWLRERYIHLPFCDHLGVIDRANSIACDDDWPDF